MEELKTEGEATATTDETPVIAVELDVAGHHYAFRGLSRRVLVMVGAGAFLLLFIVSGVFAYRGIAARSAEKEAAASAARLAATEQAAREAREREEMARIGLEVKQRHLEIIEASPSRPRSAEKAEVGVEAADTEAAAEKRASPAGPSAPADAAEKKIDGPLAGRAAAKPPAAVEVASPEAAGSCTLEGKTPADYGKALSRCLEAYSRQEGRPPAAPESSAPQRRR